MLDWNKTETWKYAFQEKIEPPIEWSINNLKENLFLKTKIGYEPNIENPKFLTEKLQWLKYNYRNSLYVKISDKLSVKDYIKEKGFEENFFPKTLQIVNNVSEFNFQELPEKFIIKLNHLSGNKGNFQVFNKNILLNLTPQDTTRLQEIQMFSITPNIGAIACGEWWYLYIEPKIFAEELINRQKFEFDNGEFYECEFRIYCFHGKPKIYQVSHNVNNITHSEFKIQKSPFNFYNSNWKRLKKLSFMGPSTRRYYYSTEENMIKPYFYKELNELCEILSEDFPFLRIDIIPSSNGLKINELTPCCCSGALRFKPYSEEIDLMLGEMIDFNKLKPYTAFQYTK
jgi:hypothetical protein